MMRTLKKYEKLFVLSGQKDWALYAQLTLVTQKVASQTENNPENLINNQEDGDLQTYLINEEIIEMV